MPDVTLPDQCFFCHAPCPFPVEELPKDRWTIETDYFLLERRKVVCPSCQTMNRGFMSGE